MSQAREMALQLTTLTVLQGDLGSIPSMRMIVYNHLELQAHHTCMSSHTSVPPT